MKTTRFGKTNLQVSRLGYGAAPAAFLKTEQKQAADMIRLLLDAGVNLIDTALMYPGSEQFIGEHLSDRRADYILVSKCGQKVPGVDAKEWSAAAVEAAVDRALKLMKTDHVDVMLLHSCDLATLQNGEAMGALVRARGAGKIRFAGYSGDNDAAAYAATLPDVAVIETSVNIVDQANIEAVLPVAVQNDVGVIAKRPVANAAWKGSEGRQGIYANYAKPYVERFAKMGLDAGRLGFAEGDWPSVALRFTLSQPGVSTAIVGTTSPANAKANLAAVKEGPLGRDVERTIRDAFADAKGADAWPGLT